MVLLTIFLPALHFLLFLGLGRYVAARHLAGFVVTGMASSLVYLLTYLPEIAAGISYSTSLGTWTASGLFEVDWNFSIDALTYVMLIVVLTVSTLVHLYSTEYMSEDPHLARFMSYLSLFTFFMLLLISADNFIGLFLGWEGVGLCSYLLISFWFTRVQANKAAIKAMIVNRIADLTFTLGILAVFYTFQTVEFSVVFGLAPYMVHKTFMFAGLPVTPLVLISLMLFLGAMGKSAQLGLHTWLPDAMEGPTPVSALIHAATMVTAGVFLLIRCSPLFELVPSVLLFVAFIGAATAFMAATAGLVQNDLKKVIAYSTCSQLGYMVFACGLSSYALSLFHLANHAFFKALLFLSAGAVIHAISSEQDMRALGGLLQLLPYTHIMFVIGSLALMGFPFLTGFYSKDLILEVAAATISVPGTFTYWFGLITAFFTAYYSLRLLYLTFYGVTRSARPYLLHAHELSIRMAGALALLALGSLFLGYLARDLFVGFGTPFWNGTIATQPLHTGAQLAGEFLPLYIKLAPLLGSLLAVSLIVVLNGPAAQAVSNKIATDWRIKQLYHFLSHKWYFDTVYNRIVNEPLLRWAYNTVFSLVDKGLLEALGPTGLGVSAWRAGRRVVRTQTGYVYDYAILLLVTLLAVGAGCEWLGMAAAPCMLAPMSRIRWKHKPKKKLISRYKKQPIGHKRSARSTLAQARFKYVIKLLLQRLRDFHLQRCELLRASESLKPVRLICDIEITTQLWLESTIAITDLDLKSLHGWKARLDICYTRLRKTPEQQRALDSTVAFYNNEVRGYGTVRKMILEQNALASWTKWTEEERADRQARVKRILEANRNRRALMWRRGEFINKPPWSAYFSMLFFMMLGVIKSIWLLLYDIITIWIRRW